MKIKTLMTAVVVSLFAATTANAALVYTDISGNTVANPNGNGGDAVTFTEQTDGSGGRYTITNNTAGSELRGVGITNPGPFTLAGYDGACFDFANTGGHCYFGQTIFENQWSSFEVGFNGETALDVWGSFESVLGDDYNNGDGVVHWYDGSEVGLGGNETEDGFFFDNGQLASNLLGFLNTGNGNVYFQTAPNTPPAVPLPAAGWMLIAGLGGLAAAGRRKKA